LIGGIKKKKGNILFKGKEKKIEVWVIGIQVRKRRKKAARDLKNSNDQKDCWEKRCEITNSIT